MFAYSGSLTDSGFSLGSLPTGFSYKLDEVSTPGQVLLDVTSVNTLTGDVNGDGIVNSQDLALVSSNWLHTGADVVGDINHDGIVNSQDLALVSSNWLATSGGGGQAVGVLAPVPEPSSLLLAAFGLALVTGRVWHNRRRPSAA